MPKIKIASRLRAVRTELTHRRVERAAHRQLSAELAAFQTPSERAELDHMLGRYPAEQTQQIREILNRQDYERQRRAMVLGGNRAA